MTNLRIIYDNAADRGTTAVSTTAGGLVAAYMRNNIKSLVHRATGTSLTITQTWTTAEIVGGVVFPFCNWSATCTIRVRAYTEVADASPAVDTGSILAAPYAALGTFDWGSVALGANAYAYGGGAYGRAWFNQAAYKKLVIDIVDTANPDGYVEASRMVAGPYWQPLINADYGASVTLVDTSKHFRNDAGDLMTDVGTKHKKLNMTLSKMAASDRSSFWNIMRGNGMSRPVFVSLFPDDPDSIQEQIYQVWGKLVSTPSMSMPSFRISSAPIDIEEI